MTYSKTELFREAQWRKCKSDPIYFFQHFWYIQHPEKGAILFELFDAQTRALEVFQRDRFVITLKARQIGWTTLCAAFAFWETFFYGDRLEIFLSRGEREAVEILRRAKYGFQRLPEWMRSRGPKLLRDNQQEMPFANGSSIESLPSKQDPARGRTVYRIFIDEWAFLENPADAWASIEATTDVGGRAIGLSTANGYGTFFHEMWVGAETGVNQFTPIFEPWSARDDRDAAWYDAKKLSLPEWQLHQEYPRNPEEAFLKSGNPFFDIDALAELETVEPRFGVVERRDLITFVTGSGGPLALWELPKHDHVYVIGADTAEGLEHGDFSSAHVIDNVTGEVVAHWHGHIPPDEFGEELDELGRFYNLALIGVEANNHGHTTLATLKARKYPNLFYHHITGERHERKTNKLGWQTTKTTRGPMLDDLAMELRRGGIVLWCKRTIKELMTFVRDADTGKLHGSPFDDRVMSLGIANQMRDHARSSVRSGKSAAPYMSYGWWLRETEEAHGKGGVTAIGARNRRRRAA